MLPSFSLTRNIINCTSEICIKEWKKSFLFNPKKNIHKNVNRTLRKNGSNFPFPLYQNNLNSFSHSAIKIKDDKVELVIDKAIGLYTQGGKELLKPGTLMAHSLAKIQHLLKQAFSDLLYCQKDSAINEIFVEVSAGVGGQEAMLFAQELLQMYEGFCLSNGWSTELIECEATALGGLRHACLSIRGADAYTKLKYEGGIHRVQRVPRTEKAGRVHTSTVSVAVLPQPSEIMIRIDAKDIRIDTMRASGAGGQHVNKTDSAIRITHISSGVVCECQTTPSQDQNRKEAMRKLRARLYTRELDEQEAKTSSQKKMQVGTKARSEKIRTYNFPQDRVTDHRLGISTHNMTQFLSGGTSLERLISELVEVGKEERLLELFQVKL